MELNNTTGEHPQRSGLDLLESEAQQHRDSPEWLHWLLRLISCDDDWLADVAERSCLHANGFYKIILEPDSCPRLRLHVWPQDRPGTGELNPHGHCWPFASWIITGRFREHVYVKHDEGELFDEYSYGKNIEWSPDLPPTSSTRLARLRCGSWDAGAVYSREPGELHLAEPAADGLVATLVVQGKDEQGDTPVYRSPGQGVFGQNEPISPALLRHLLVQVKRVLQPVS